MVMKHTLNFSYYATDIPCIVSSESFQVDKNGRELKISAEFIIDDLKYTFTRYYGQKPDPIRQRLSTSVRSLNRPLTPILFTNSRSCRGWKSNEIRSIKLLDKTSVTVSWAEKLGVFRRAPPRSGGDGEMVSFLFFRLQCLIIISLISYIECLK